MSPLSQVQADLAHDDLLRKACPPAAFHDPAGVIRFGHGHETVVFSKTLTLPPVQGVGILSAHDQIHSPQWQESQIGEGPKAPVSDKHIASPQGATEQGKKPHLMILPRSVGRPQERA
jgi:hypothetical protein